MTKQTAKSQLMESLRDTFEYRAKGDDRYLLVYWQGWGETVKFVGTKSGEWPWSAHDAYMANDNSASILALALDLKEEFDAQIPEHMRDFETLESFAFRPLIHIPDRTGQIPAKEQQAAIEKMLRPAPVLKLVK